MPFGTWSSTSVDGDRDLLRLSTHDWGYRRGSGRDGAGRSGATSPVERGLAAERAAAVVDVRLELFSELVDVARDRHRGRVAERAQALAEDPVAHAQVAGRARTGRSRPSSIFRSSGDHPARPLAARRALTARLVLVELRDLAGRAAKMTGANRRSRSPRRSRTSSPAFVSAVVSRAACRPSSAGQHRHRRAARDDRLQLPGRPGSRRRAHRSACAASLPVLELEVAWPFATLPESEKTARPGGVRAVSDLRVLSRRRAGITYGHRGRSSRRC